MAFWGRTAYLSRMSNVSGYFEKIEEAAAYIQSKVTLKASLGMVLGSGLGGFAEGLDDVTAIAYADIPHFPVSSVSGHAGKLVVGSIEGQQIVVMQGRVHYYEGYSMQEVTFPVRVLAQLGVKQLLLTNAAGTVNESFAPGDVMIIRDHLNLTGDNPLIGRNDDRLGVRFPDMSEVYSSKISDTMQQVADASSFKLCSGVYAGLSGPSYETPAEIRMLRTLGADAVGMSTVAEAIVAKHGGLDVFGLSVITNYAAGMSSQPLDHQEVKDTGEMVKDKLSAFLRTLVSKL